MGGIGSGRKAYTDDQLRSRVVNKSWIVLEKFFDNPKIKNTKKAEIASRICVKNMPQEISGGLNLGLKELIENVYNANIGKATANGTTVERFSNN